MGVGSLLIFFTNPGFIAFSNLLGERSTLWVASHKTWIIKPFSSAHKDFSVIGQEESPLSPFWKYTWTPKFSSLKWRKTRMNIHSTATQQYLFYILNWSRPHQWPRQILGEFCHISLPSLHTGRSCLEGPESRNPEGIQAWQFLHCRKVRKDVHFMGGLSIFLHLDLKLNAILAYIV